MTSTTAWALVGLLALVTAVIKGAGPFALGGRELPSWFSRVIMFMAPALLAALVVYETFGAKGSGITIDARAAGLGVAIVAIALRAPMLFVILIAAAATAGVRAFS